MWFCVFLEDYHSNAFKLLKMLIVIHIAYYSKLNDNTVILGGKEVIYLVDIKTCQINQFKYKSLGVIFCLYVNGN